MEWYEYTTSLPAYKDYKIFKNDINLKPDWVEHPAENTEFHVIKGRNTVLVVVGESWTYGESLPGIATGIQQYSLDSQLAYAFGPLLSNKLNVDLYQYAVPGNCNFYMYSSLDRILDYLTSNFNYKNIKVCIQMTEPSREHPIINKLIPPYQTLYDIKEVKTFNEWLVRYDEILLDECNRVQSQYNVEVLVWKNFCPFQNKKEYTNLNLIKETWIQFSGRMLGVNAGNQRFQSVGWFDNFYNENKSLMKFDLSELSKELDEIEISNKFIKGNKLHNNHPTSIGHKLWAENIYNEYTK